MILTYIIKNPSFSNKKGFTLVELLASIIILVTIMTLVIPSVTGIMKNANVSMSKSKIRSIETNAIRYANNDINKYQKCRTSVSDACYIDPGHLIDAGLLEDDDLIDPIDNSEYSGSVLICFDANTLNITSKYEKQKTYSCN